MLLNLGQKEQIKLPNLELICRSYKKMLIKKAT